MFDRTVAISLDLDDTLWDIGAVINRAEQRTGQWLTDNHGAMAEYLGATSIGSLRATVVTEHPENAHDFGFVRREIYRRAAIAVGERDSDSVADRALAEFQRWRNTVDLFADVEPALAALATDRRLIALTNGTADLTVMPIGRFFADSVTAADAGVAKPERAIFELAATRLGIKLDTILHVGDDPVLDVDGARRAGMATVWVNRNDQTWPDDLPRPTLAVTTLAQLVDALGAD
ncbi:MAG: HAD-IA family hydrolase [Pseudomonadota bacterium]